jgi:GTP-binding protein
MYKVALVGQANVGKSTLFNRLLKKRQSVISDIAGTTRDRLEAETTILGTAVTILDMAGLEPSLNINNQLTSATQEQISKAINEADLLLWVVDGQKGIGQHDHRVENILRDQNKPVIIVVNKCDDPKHDLSQYEFFQLGFKDVFPISASHARGMQPLLEKIAEFASQKPETNEGEKENFYHSEQELKLGIVGRPNVGKSTLLNALLEEERSVVSEVAGTTRDSVDSPIPAEHLFGNTFTKWGRVRLIDTAGIRKRGKLGHSIEAWSAIRTYDAIDQAQVVILVLEALEGLTHQDLQISQHLVEAGRPVVLVINKWDLYLEYKKIIFGTKEDESSQNQFLDSVRLQAPFLYWVPVLFISAKEKINLEYLGRLVLSAYNAWSLKVTPEQLREVTDILRNNPRLKNISRLEMSHNQPPVFQVYLEGSRLPHFSTNRQIENVLREQLNIGPTPIKIWINLSRKREN